MMIKKIVVIALVAMAIAMQITGGYMDMKDIPFYGPGISKEHLWSDATFLLLLAVFINNF